MLNYILPAVVAIFLLPLYLACNYVWFVRVYLVKKKDNKVNFIKRHREFQAYISQVKSGNITPYPEIESFLSENSAKYDNFWGLILFRCICTYVYGLVIGIVLVPVVSTICEQYSVILALPVALVIIVASIPFMHSKSINQFFELDSILDDYNWVIVQVSMYLKKRKYQ